MDDIQHSSSTEVLYQAYRQFFFDGVEASVELFPDEQLRATIREIQQPMSKTEFFESLRNMTPMARSRFLRRINLGFELASLATNDSDIARIVNKIVAERSDRESKSA